MKYKNTAREKYLSNFPDSIIENNSVELKNNIKFSFCYFDNSQSAGQDFKDLTQEQLEKFLTKLKHYSKNTIKHWNNQKVGKGGLSILEIYDKFPPISDFKHPKHIPLDVQWARFRLEGDMRLIGFIIPNEIATELELDPSIFYIVFLDSFHKFYKSK